MKTFDWDNPYSEDNATIIKSLITESSSISIANFSKVLFSGNLKNIKKHLIKLAKIKKGDRNFSYPFHQPKQETITENTLIEPYAAINRLIDDGVLPITLKRLPRDPSIAAWTFFCKARLPENLETAFEYSHDYYPEHAEKYEPLISQNAEAIDNLVKTPANFSEECPPLWSYIELKERWKNNAILDVFSQCFTGKLGAYFKISNRNTSSYYVETKHYGAQETLNLLMSYNCGNPFYKKRYLGLERLTLHDVNTLFHHSVIKQPPTISIFPLQTTDMETKFHLRRNLVSQTEDGFININIDDLVFLREEVIAIEERNNAELGRTHDATPLSSQVIEKTNREDDEADKPTSTHKTPKTNLEKSNRVNALHMLLNRIYHGELKRTNKKYLTATDIWAVLENQDLRCRYDLDEIIQEVTSDRIYWMTYKGKDRSLGRLSFDNRKWLKKE